MANTPARRKKVEFDTQRYCLVPNYGTEQEGFECTQT
jgi:hypothetical protein